MTSVLWTGLGLGYSPTQLTAALAARTLVEWRHRVDAAADLPLLRAELRR